MKIVESDTPNDCLRIVIASLLEVAVESIPWHPVVDEASWSRTWNGLIGWLAGRGWHLLWNDVEGVARVPLELFLASLAGTAHYVIVSVQHPTMQAGWAHALLVRGDDVVLYPPTGGPDAPIDELEVVGVGVLVPIDPAAFTHRRRVMIGA